MASDLPRANHLVRTALITGACSGIGLAIAQRLGSLGYDLVLVSNRSAELAQAADTIRSASGVAVHTFVFDLARSHAADELYEAVRSRGLAIDIFVSNAGILIYGEAVDADVDRARTLLELHVVTPSLLCTLLGRDMRARGRGHILIVSSISAWRDFPAISYYGSSKRYLRSFASVLRSEMAVYGVNVTCLAPGPVATALYEKNVPVELAQKLGIMMDPKEVAETGLAAMFAGEAEFIPGWFSRAMTLATVLSPERVMDAVRRQAYRISNRKDNP